MNKVTSSIAHQTEPHETLIENVREFSPRWVGITVIYYNNAEFSVRLSKKTFDRSAHIAVGTEAWYRDSYRYSVE